MNDAWSDKTTVDFEYDATGNVTKRKNNGTSDVTTEYAYNARSEGKSVNHKVSSTSKYKMDYTRDGVGNPLQIAFSGDSWPQYDRAEAVRYSYDTAGRLYGQDWGYWSQEWGWDSLDDTHYYYDWVGNRNPSQNTYNQVDMLNKDNGYKYDYLGNLTYKPDNSSYPRTEFLYNDDNLLKEVHDVVSGGGSSTTTIAWDADQQRLKLAKGSDTWEMMYDPVAGIPAVLLAKNYVSSNTTYAYHVRMPGGELLASFDDAGSNTRYYHFDYLGSTVLMSTGTGGISASNTYDTWGSVLASSGSGMKPYEYVGELGYYTHSSQGTALGDLFQLGVRFYDPETGRFTQRDPIGYVGGLNQYVYAADNPSNWVDPTGEIFWAPGIIWVCRIMGGLLICEGIAKIWPKECHEQPHIPWEDSPAAPPIRRPPLAPVFPPFVPGRSLPPAK